MSIDELWELHADVIFEFEQKLLSEEIELEERLRHIHAAYRSRRPIGSGILTLDRLSGLSGGARQLHGTKFATSTFLRHSWTDWPFVG